MNRACALHDAAALPALQVTEYVKGRMPHDEDMND